MIRNILIVGIVPVYIVSYAVSPLSRQQGVITIKPALSRIKRQQKTIHNYSNFDPFARCICMTDTENIYNWKRKKTIIVHKMFVIISEKKFYHTEIVMLFGIWRVLILIIDYNLFIFSGKVITLDTRITPIFR